MIKADKYLKRLNVVCGSEMFLVSQYYNGRLYNIGIRINNNKHDEKLISPHGLFYARLPSRSPSGRASLRRTPAPH